MRLFVTGGTGFVGAHFVRQALAAGHAVVALRRPGSRPRLPLPQAPQWHDGGLDTVDPAWLHGCDALVHFASAGVSPQRASWHDMLHANVTLQTALLGAAAQAGVRRVVLAGSFAEYGRAADAFDSIPPDAPLLPVSGYAASKAAGFVAAHAFAVEHALELNYLRIFSAFGESQYEANFWPALRAAALAGRDFDMTPGEQVRDYIDVADVAAAFLHAALAPPAAAGGSPVVVRNVGSGRPVRMQAFARHWWRTWQAAGRLNVGALPYRPDEVMRFVPMVEHPADPPWAHEPGSPA